MQVLGVIGHPIDHSLSPQMHNAAFQAVGRDALYVPLLVQPDAVQTALAGAKALGFFGLNVTVPHKQAVIPFMDHLTAEAQAVGSVNTIRFENGRMYGHSTDGPGFRAALEQKLITDIADCSFLILGAGGAARAIAAELGRCGAHITIANRTAGKAKDLAYEFAHSEARGMGLDPHELSRAMAAVDVVVNTTTVGMHASRGESPIPRDLLRPDLRVVDIIYNPQETQLLVDAASLGCPVLNGIGMLVWQAAKSWEFWWGVSPPTEVMEAAVRSALSSME